MKKTITVKVHNSSMEKFSEFCDDFDIKIINTWSKEDFWGEFIVFNVLRLEKTSIPLELKEEKLKEHWGKNIVPNEEN